MKMQSLLRFRIRTLLMVIAVIAIYLAWRLYDPERAAVDAIVKAGGRVHFNFQEPSPSFSFTSIGMMPENIYFSQVRVTDYGPAKPPRPDVIGFLLGNHTDNRVSIAELKLEQMSPAIVRHLKSLKHLRFIVLDMPQGIISKDSAEARQVEELKLEFGGKLFSAYNRGIE